MHRVFLDSYRQFYSVAVEYFKHVQGDVIVNENVIHKNSLVVYGKLFENSELSGSHRPVFRRVFAAPSAEVAGRSKRSDFHVVDVHRDIRRPVVVVVNRLRADFKGKGNLAQRGVAGGGAVLGSYSL